MPSADLTRRELTFGAQDPITGWFKRIYFVSTIRGSIQPQGASLTLLPVGSFSRYPNTLFTGNVVKEGDQIVDADLDVYELNTVQKWSWLNKFSHYTCEAVKKQFTDRPAASGTWHLDSASLTTDPRSRHKIYLDYWITASNLKKDDALTAAEYITCFDQADYPIKHLFLSDLGLIIDLVFSVGKEPATPRNTHNHNIYAFEETVPITVYAVNKADVTATNLIEQAEQEIRRIVTAHPIGSVRFIHSTKHNPIDLGDRNYLYSTTVTIRYVRANPDFDPTDPPAMPYFSYGTGWNYDGDRLSGGIEGTWTTGDNPAIDSRDFLKLTRAGSNVSTVNGTNLNLSTTIYPKIRYRYKCSNASVIPVITVGFSSGTQTITLPNSTTLTVGTATLTAAKTVNTVTPSATVAAGSVDFDFFEIYAGDYVLPNCTKMSPPEFLSDAVIKVPYMVGNRIQALGADSMRITMTCDLDVENDTVTWMRPQGSSSKTDKINVQVFNENRYAEAVSGARNVPWHWVNWGKGACKMRLTRMSPSYANDNTIELEFTEYRLSSAGVSHENANTQYSLDQVT
jgi:hypothetical protein